MSLVIRGNPWLASERKREKGSFVLSKNGPRCVHHTRPPSHYSSVITVVARATPRELDTSRTIVMWRFIRWISLCPGKTGPFIARRWIIGLFARRLWLRVSESRIILTISMVFLSPSLSLSLSLSLCLLVIFEDSCESPPRGTKMMDIRLIFTIVRGIPSWIWTWRGVEGRAVCKLDYRGDSKGRECYYISRRAFVFSMLYLLVKIGWIRARYE